MTKEIEYNELDGSIHELPEFHPSPDRYILLAMMVAAGVLSGLVSITYRMRVCGCQANMASRS